MEDIITTVSESSISGLDTVWVLLAAMLVFFMQPGFALVEAGFTRSKNTANILMKNFVDFMVGSFLFWIIRDTSCRRSGRVSEADPGSCFLRSTDFCHDEPDRQH